MTLLLDIHSLDETGLFGGSDMICVVEGSQSGVLRSKPLSGSKWSPAFEVRCSNKDNLLFQIFKENKIDDDTFVGEAAFHAKSFINNHALEVGIQIPYNHEIVVEKNNKLVGVLKASIRYDKAKKYEGELSAIGSVNLGEHSRQRVRFYKGKCQTTNLFSFLDSSAEGQRFKAVESLYRDQ